MLIEVGFKEDCILKNMFSNYIIFKEHVEIVKIYMVKFSVTISSRLKTVGFYN